MASKVWAKGHKKSKRNLPKGMIAAKELRLVDHGARLCRKKKRKGRIHATAYIKRNQVLKRLGYSSYSEYLKSPLWTSIRKSVLENCPTCELCQKKPATTVHHIGYRRDTLTGKSLLKLVSICDPCHRKVEFKPDGRKREFEATMKTTRKILRRNGRWKYHIKQRQSRRAADSESNSHDGSTNRVESQRDSAATEASDGYRRKHTSECGDVPDGARDTT